MKTFMLLAAGAALAAAQTLSDLPPCGQTCVTNMIAIANSNFGCTTGNITCYCTNQDFGFGIRDCANEACSAQDAARVITFGTNYCENALSSGQSTMSGSALSVLTSASVTGPSGSVVAVPGSVTANSTGSGATGGALTTSALTTVITTNGNTLTSTTGSTVISAVAITTSPLTNANGKTTGSTTISLATVAGNSSSMASSMATTTTTKKGGSGPVVTKMGKTTQTTKVTKTTATTNGGGSGGQAQQSSSTSGGANAMYTAAPAFIGAAALAILAL